MKKRVFLIVLDSFGVGAAPDAAQFGDAGCSTLGRISRSPRFSCENLRSMGLGNIDGVQGVSPVPSPASCYCRMTERSAGKDTTVGHWEIAGAVSPRPLPTYPHGFPEGLLRELEEKTGRGWLCNRPYSGTEVLLDYGEEHLHTGKLIVYTSADSVFQIAAHTDIVPTDELYRICECARALLCGENAVGRVIARPFAGEVGHFYRTDARRDFSLPCPKPTLPDAVSDAGKEVIAVGKIRDIFAGRGITDWLPTHSNAEGMAALEQLAGRDFEGLCFANLVDFDMLWGHRRDIDGYAAGLAAFDRWLPSFTARMRAGDLLMITADHGCDPGYSGTDHTREYTPLLLYGTAVPPQNGGTRSTFADIAATAAAYLGIPFACDGTPILTFGEAPTDAALCRMALSARERAYAPYSGYRVGAALLCASGAVYTGCNIENAAYTPTVCAERTAIFSAVCAGERHFCAIAVAGGMGSEPISGGAPPCGVCRQVMAEFCDSDFRILIVTGENIFREETLGALLPGAFGPHNLRSAPSDTPSPPPNHDTEETLK